MFTTKRKINFYDCDPAGILFFGRVYEISHSAYEEMISGFNLEEDYWNNAEYVVPILNSEAHYHKPIKYGETVTVNIAVSKLKTSSFELEYEIENEQGVLCTAIKTVHIFVDKKAWKKIPIKEDIKKGLEKYFANK